MKKAIVISAFPACGKSYLFENIKDKVVLDSDSSEYSWVVNEDGKKVRNPEFPSNYIKHIKNNLKKADIIFVSSHLVVRQAMADAGISYVTVYPESSMKAEWIGRCFLRGNDEDFLHFIADSWDKFMDCIYDEPHGKKLYRLTSNEYLADILNEIIDENTEAISSLPDISEDIEEIYAALKDDSDSSPRQLKTIDGIQCEFVYNHRRNDMKIEVNLGPAAKFYRKYDFIKQEYDGSYITWPAGSVDYKAKQSEFAKQLGIKDEKLGCTLLEIEDRNLIFTVILKF